MAFKINKVFDIKGIIFLVLLAIPLIVSTNIDCDGKPFHCINSTHFMICVDLGGGVSITVDNFIIPCPPTTVCQGTNRFECEFAPTIPKLELIPTDGAHNVEIIATTSLPDVITTTNGIFEDNFNTVSTMIVSENEAMRFTTRQPEEIITNQFGDEEDGKFKSVSTPYIESGLEISTAISDIIAIDVNISKDSINLFLDKNSEIIAIANNTYANGKEPLTENLPTLQNNGDVAPTEALQITTINTPTETSVSTTSNISTTNAESLELVLGRFQNKTHVKETNSDIVKSTNSATFKNIAPTDEIATMLPAYEITTDKPLTFTVENNSFEIKYNIIDMLTTTEKYHDTNTTERLSKNVLSVRNDAISEKNTAKNEFNNNNEIIEGERYVSTIASNDLTTTAYTNYYETETVQTTQLYDETITETLNPAADVMITENSHNNKNEIIPTHDTETADVIFTTQINVTNDTTLNSTDTAGLTFTTESNVITEITSNSTENADVIFTTEGYVVNRMTSNSTGTADVIFTAGSNATNDTTSNRTEAADVIFTTKSNVINDMSNSTGPADEIFTTGSAAGVIFTAGSNATNNTTSNSMETADVIFTTDSYVMNGMSNSTGTADVILSTGSNVMYDVSSNSTEAANVIFTTKSNVVNNVTSNSTETAGVIFTAGSYITNGTMSNSTEAAGAISTTESNVITEITSYSTETADVIFTTGSIVTNDTTLNSTATAGLTFTTESNVITEITSNSTENADVIFTIENSVMNDMSKSTGTTHVIITKGSNVIDDITSNSKETAGVIFTTESNVINYMSNSTGTADVIFTTRSNVINDITSNSKETAGLIFTTESNVVNSITSNSTKTAGVIFTAGSNAPNDTTSNSMETTDVIFTTDSYVMNGMSNSTGTADVILSTGSNVMYDVSSNSTEAANVIFTTKSNVMNNVTSNSTETAGVIFTAGSYITNGTMSNSTEAAGVISTTESNVITEITSNSTETADVIFTTGSNVTNDTTLNSTATAALTFTTESNVITEITSNSTENADVIFTIENSLINDMSNSTGTTDAIITKGSNVIDDITSNSKETAGVIFTTESNVVNGMNLNSTETAGVIFTTESYVMNDMSNITETAEVVVTTGSTVKYNVTSNSTETANVIFTTKSNLINDTSNRTETGDVIFITGSSSMNNIKSNSPKTEDIIFTTESNVTNDITSNNSKTAGVIFTAGSNITNDTVSNSTEAAGIIFTTESNVMNDMSNSMGTVDVIFTTVLNNPIMKILKGETSTALLINEVETSTETSFSLIQNDSTDSISTAESQTITLTPVNITSNKTNSEVSENEFTTTHSITNSGVNNSTESFQELYLASTLINSTQSKSSDAQETSKTDTASSDATTQSVLIFHKSGETTTTQIPYLLPDSSNITDIVIEFDSLTKGHLTEVITDGLSKNDLHKENNLVPRPMPLLQDLMTGKSAIGQEEDNLITTTASNLETQLHQGYSLETLLNNALKNSVNNSVQPGQLSELVMAKVTTPKVIDPSYLFVVSTPDTTKRFQVLLNKSDDSVTETIQENYAQHNESITIKEKNPLSLKMSQHIDTLTNKRTNSSLNEDMKRTETATSSPNIAEISHDMSILININNNEDKKKDTFMYTPPSNINAFKINDSNFSPEVPVTSNLNFQNETSIQPSNVSLITPPAIKLDAAESIQNILNKSEQINSPKIESLSPVSILVGIDQEKTRNLDFSINSEPSTEKPKYLSEDTHVTVGQNMKFYTDNLLDVQEGISRPVSNVQSDLATTFAVTFDEKNVSMTAESYIAKLQAPSVLSPSLIKNTPNLVPNNRPNEQNTSLNRDSTLLPTSDSRSDFQNVSDFQVHSLNRKDIATETLPLANISDSNRAQSKQSLKVTDTTIETKENRNETFNTTKYYFHETTDQMNKSYFNCLNYSRGRYADKDNCRKFYICVGKFQPIEGMCPVDTVFSEIRKQCTKNLSQCIRNNQFVCTSEGRYGDFLQDNVYYVCVRNSSANDHYIRFKLQCQNGYYLNQTSVKCIPKVTESNQSLSSNQSLTSNSENTNIYSSSSSNQSVTIRSQEMKKPSRNIFICEGEGKFADPNDCRKYYVCYKNSKSVLKRKKKECDSDEVFDKDTKKCKDSESPEC